ncbi:MULTISPECIES: MlaD family protein [unclassified Pseudomonas]|uniref:PqiB family protein n=1 Tax=unclassified Pseudomonas TaxID=196821 RepID=UPI002AC947C4|nr:MULTISPECIES: MlaD family protein [unclassified Pseudomonas]MEB0043170.1 MlaD family protein [Pseudomonas sp. MH10]MEB0123378.1 MlaD family protein [Pseudomonas sp. CCI1.2]WPX64689.1 MlaD family protein [Pseudomonas sp. MH10]
MPENPKPTASPVPGAAEIKHRGFNVSLVWIVPIVAALVGLSMLVHNAISAGPEITLTFQTAEGLQANKTQVKYKNVVIGEVTAIALSKDRSHVDVTLDLDASAKTFATQGSRFWVVRPRIGANGISGIDTLLSGAFIGADAGASDDVQKDFVGLETPPPVTYAEKGTRYSLRTDSLGSLDIGSAVYYRRITVGQVVSYQLSPDGKGVDVQIFVTAPNDKFVTRDSRFWNASGVDISLSAEGLKLNTQSVSAILAGGIAFVEPKYNPDSQAAEEGTQFALFADQDTAMAPIDGPSRYIRMRFDQPLRGLTVNAPIDFHGVTLGRVVSVDLDYDPVTKDFPTLVGAVIYPNRLGKAHEKLLREPGKDDDARALAVIAQLVEKGLRAQARNGNLLTGQLYIALDFVPGAKPVTFDLNAKPAEVPTVPASLDKLQEQLQSIVNKINKLPIDQIANNLNGSLAELQLTLKQVNGSVLPQMRDTLVQTRKTLASANEAFAEDSPQRQELSQSMQEVKRTARSVRVLTDFIGRHPEALIRGRLKGAEPDGYKSSPSASRDTANDP